MASSLGLKLYNLANRRKPAAAEDRPARPAGRLVWLHAPGAEAARSLLDLARRLAEEDGVQVVMTCADPLPPHDGVILQPSPPDTPETARAFLDHFRPELAVFSEGELRPASMAEADRMGVPMILVNGREPSLLQGRDHWYPGLMRGTLSRLRRVMTVDETAAREFRRQGAALSAVSVTGRMEVESAALPCSEAERAALARLFATRPVWLAVDLPEAEEAAVIAAHRSVLLLAHRTLLILVPADPARSPDLAAALESEGWTVSRRSRDEEPDDETEVFLVDGGNEHGLWYRLSPISFLGGSLTGGGCRRDPLEAAALGSALVCGPEAGGFGATYARLRAARAMRVVGAAGDLAEAVGELLAPDRAARLAQSAWAACSDGAEATETVLTEIRRIMDGEG